MDRAAVAAVAALEDDIRRRLFEFVRGVGRPVTRDEAARTIGISRNLAAFHLDKLVEVGLLQSGFGDGPRRVGRAPRLYEPGAAEVAVRLPERTPEVLAEILMSAVLEQRPRERAAATALRVARERGAALGAEERKRLRTGRIGRERALTVGTELLARHGYQPYRCGASVRLRNCPFHALAGRAPQFVCGLNREYLAGVIDGLGAGERLDAALAPHPGECCVEVRPAT